MTRRNFVTGVSNINMNSSNAAFTNNTNGFRVVNSGDLWVGNNASNIGNVIIQGNANAYGTQLGALTVTGDAVFQGNVKVDGGFYEPNTSPRFVSATITAGGSYTQPDAVCTVSAPDAIWGTQATVSVQMLGTGFSNTTPFQVTSLTIINSGSGYTQPPTLTFTSAGGGTSNASATSIMNSNYLRCSYSSNVDIRPGDVFFSYSATPSPLVAFGATFYHDTGANNPSLFVSVGNLQAQVPNGYYKYLGGFFAFQSRGWYQRVA